MLMNYLITQIKKCIRLFFFYLPIAYIIFSCDTPFKVGIIGDQFGAVNADSAYAVMDQAVTRLKNEQPDVVVHVGDMVESVRNIQSYEDYYKNWQTAASIMGKLKQPWFLALGDHDVVPPEFKPMSADHSREKWAMKLGHDQGLPIDSLPYYGVSIKGYHLIFLYSLDNLHTDPRWGSIFLNSISDKQMMWLETELNTHHTSKGIIIVVHHPHWYVWSNWYRIHDLIRKHPVKAVIAGHYHYPQEEGMIDGIRYFVMGSTGGAIKNTDPNSGGSQMFGIMTLSGNDHPKIVLQSLTSGKVIETASRRSMDRIQAIECMLDGLWQDENIIRMKDKFYSKCAERITPLHSIGLESISNPIDVPIKIAIEPDSCLFKKSRWNSNSVSIDGRVILNLEPGQEIGWANYSNVGKWHRSNAVWEGELNLSELKKNNSVSLNIFVCFTDDRTRTIRRNITFHIK